MTAAVDLRTVALDGLPAEEDRDLLARDELVRAERIGNPDVRDRFIAVRAALRRLVAEHVGQEPRDIVIATTAHGCPWLPDHPGLHVSVSHTRDLALVAVAGQPVGVDVERRDRTRIPAVSAWLTPDERRRLDAVEQSARPAELLRLWTIKEAAAKAVGLGLLTRLRRVRVDGSAVTVFTEGGRREQLTTRPAEVGPDHVASLATSGWRCPTTIPCAAGLPPLLSGLCR